jgi:hypothetical protein
VYQNLPPGILKEYVDVTEAQEKRAACTRSGLVASKKPEG